MLTRAVYAEVILRNGQLVAWLRRNNPNLLVFLPADEPERSQVAAGLSHFLSARGQDRMRTSSHQGVLITTINGQPVAAHPMARFLMDAGFHPGPAGTASCAAFPSRSPTMKTGPKRFSELLKAGPVCDGPHVLPAGPPISIVIRGQWSGGYFQWVLDAACETVEWPYQPLGFDSLALRLALGLRNCLLREICAKVVSVSQAASSFLTAARQRPRIDNPGPLPLCVLARRNENLSMR